MLQRSRLLILAVLGLLAALVVPTPAQAVVDPTAPVFINELHYDNAGGDVGEFVEVAGPAGTDLSGWSIELINGSNGAMYDTIDLTGVIADQDDGFGTASFARAGIQNGAPDGLALVAPGGVLVEFLSYEGTITATDGAASGQQSTDLGVAESSSTPAGFSLARTGTGGQAGDFAWQPEAAESPGAVNAGQDFVGVVAPPFISEIHYDNVGADFEEFIEIEGSAGTDLVGWSLVLYNGSNAMEYNTIALGGSIGDQGAGRGAVVILIPGLQNGSPDGVALVFNDGSTETVVEFLSYEGSLVAIDGPAAGMTSVDIGVSETSSTPIGESLQLIDGAWTGPAAWSPGLVNTAPQPAVPAVFISEIHYDNDGSDIGEFVEVTGPAGQDLTGVSLVPYNGSNGTTYGVTALSGAVDDEGSGSGAVSFPISGLQNGSPDGIALVFNDGSTDTVIEFLSYEGSFAATNGPAVGLTSVDIGVSETGSTTVGDSLQLVPPVSSTGTWQGPQPSSEGSLNDAPVLPGIPFPFTENFDTDCVANGWQIVSVDADTGNTWSCSTAFSNADVNGFGDTAAADEWLISPAFDMGAQNDETLDFRNFTNFTDSGTPHPQLEVVYSTDYDGSGDPSTATWTELVGINYSLENSGQYVDSGTIDLTGISGGRANFAFHYTSSGTASGEAANWRIDSIAFGPTGPVTGTPAKVHEVQGSGPSVAITTPVEVQAIVTSLFENEDALDGFFIQEEDADVDADPATSEGIFAFCRGACPAGLLVGDQVTVVGTPNEFQGMSQIDVSAGSVTVDAAGAALPSATAVSLPAAGRTDAEATFEATEGMLVSFPDELFVSEYFELARFGHVVLTEGGVPEQFTDTSTPSVAGYNAFLDDLNARRIFLDDDNSDPNDSIFGPAADEPSTWPVGGLSTTNLLRGGDSISDLTGVLHWSRQGDGTSSTDAEQAWRVRPVQDPSVSYEFTSNSPREAAPAPVGGTLRVASFNVLNYFLSLDDGSSACNFACRGADSAVELQRQRDKIVAAMATMDVDVLGLIEIENDSGAAAADLVAALNGATAPGTYAAIDTGTIGTDAIKQAFVYKPATVTPVGAFALLDSSVDPTYIDTKNRPALIQTFEEVATGARVTIAVNHFKSKGSACDDVADPGLGDGQANCNGTRTAAAVALASYLATDPTGGGTDNQLVIGDLNAYAMEDPITALTDAGYTNLVSHFGGDEAYSYVFDGQRGYLDHALANATLMPQVTGTTAWHINADEAPLLDYNDEVTDSPAEASFERESGATDLYAPDAYRASDHDPVIVGLALAPPLPTCGGLPATIIGTEAGETIKGTNGDDVIVGLGGNDTIRGRGGNDVICGGDGDDHIRGDGGDDILFGDSGEDYLIGGAGNDSADGGDDHDHVYGNAGNDVLFGGSDSAEDDLRGGGGDDTLDGGDGPDRLTGSKGDDVIIGGGGDDWANGGAGLDDISGGVGDDDLRGGSGDDTIDGGADIDALHGGGGTDTCTTGESLRSCEL